MDRVKCSHRDPTDLIGMICRQCRPNGNYPYVKRRIYMQTTESTWMTSTQSMASTEITESVASSLTMAFTINSRPIALIGFSGLSNSDHLLYYIILSISVLLNALLVVWLVLCLLCKRRTLVALPQPTASRPDLNTRPDSYDCYDIEHLKDEGEWDTGEINAPSSSQPLPQPAGQATHTYANCVYFEPQELVESRTTLVTDGAEARARLTINSSAYESHQQSGRVKTF